MAHASQHVEMDLKSVYSNVTMEIQTVMMVAQAYVKLRTAAKVVHVADGFLLMLQDSAQLYVEMALRSALNNVMMPILIATTDVILTALYKLYAA